VRRLAPALTLAGLLLPAAADPQAPAQEPKPFVLEAEVEVVSVTVVAFDKSGHFVRGLGPGDIELLEDGVPQDISLFREAKGKGDEEIPLSVVLVLDTSGSMKESLDFLKEAALNFVYKLEDVDTALVVQFNETIKGSTDFTGDTDRLERFVNSLQAWGGTSLYDATHYGLERIKDQPGRKAAILFSDGADNTSRMDEKTVVDFAKMIEATVYGIGFKGSSFSGGSASGFLKRISSETGGEFFSPDKVSELIKTFAAISDELKNHYILAYTPKRAPDNMYRKIELRVKREGVQVRLRKGYVATKRRRPRPAPRPPQP
jgi:Ca-activated chloride channel family protein